MDSVDFDRLAKGLAAELGTLRSEEWTVTADETADARAVLAGGIARLSVSLGWRTGRLRVRGLDADGNVFRTWDITASPDRGAPAIAKDVNRRILAAGYADDLIVARAKKTAREVSDAARAAWLDQAAELFGIARPKDHTRGADPHKVYLGQFVKGSGYVQSYGYGDTDTDYLDINLSGIPAQVMLDMLAVLAAHVRAQVQCCRAYGPGHPPQFAVTGCLRERSERGEDASRNRAGLLLQVHGAGTVQTYDALAEARERGVSVIERDGQALAVVSWDYEGCGEYTVEIPRKDAS
jgi:hypothetical protein